MAFCLRFRPSPTVTVLRSFLLYARLHYFPGKLFKIFSASLTKCKFKHFSNETIRNYISPPLVNILMKVIKGHHHIFRYGSVRRQNSLIFKCLRRFLAFFPAIFFINFFYWILLQIAKSNANSKSRYLRFKGKRNKKIYIN